MTGMIHSFKMVDMARQPEKMRASDVRVPVIFRLSLAERNELVALARREDSTLQELVANAVQKTYGIGS